MVKSLFWVFAFLALGEAIGQIVPLPGSVIGMVLLAISLGRGLVPAEEVRPAADVLLKNMAFFFVPSGVAVVLEGEALSKDWLPLTVASVVSTFAVMITVALLTGRGEPRREAGSEAR